MTKLIRPLNNSQQTNEKTACQTSPTLAAFILLHIVRRPIPLPHFHKFTPHAHKAETAAASSAAKQVIAEATTQYH